MFETITTYEYGAFAFRDTWKTFAITTGLFLALLFMLIWIAANVEGQVQVVLVFGMLLLVGFAAYSINLIKSKVPGLQPFPVGTVSIGHNFKVVLLFTFVALLIGYYLVTQRMTVALPLEVQYKQIIPPMDYIYKVIVAPTIEEMGLRGVMLISSALIIWHFLRRWLIALLIGMFISSLGFGIFHWLIYQQEFALIGAAVLFGLISCGLMIVSKSVVPSIALHFANNQLIHSKGEPTIFLIITAIVLALLIFVWIRGNR